MHMKILTHPAQIAYLRHPIKQLAREVQILAHQQIFSNELHMKERIAQGFNCVRRCDLSPQEIRDFYYN